MKRRGFLMALGLAGPAVVLGGCKIAKAAVSPLQGALDLSNVDIKNAVHGTLQVGRSNIYDENDYSIYVEKIDAGAITTEKIACRHITARELAVGSISATNISLDYDHDGNMVLVQRHGDFETRQTLRR